MKLRIFWGIFCVSVAAMILTLSGMMLLSQKVARDNSLQSLTSFTRSLASSVNHQGIDTIQDGMIFPCRVTLIKADGTVFFDSESSASQMANHFQREEFKEALKFGVGTAERLSDTLSERTDYYAIRLANGDVLRCSVTESTVFRGVGTLFLEALLILIISAAVSALYAGRIAKNIVKPINDINLDNPLESEIYEELSPLIRRLDSQQKHIASQIEHIRRQNEELSAITASMTEGLVILNARGEVISLNKSARKILHCNENAVGHSFLAIDHSDYVRELFEGDPHDMETSRTSIERDGRIYDVFISRVGNEELLGYALIFVNVTAARQAEMQRREFTANVSHELKTPLQSIIGSAELLESGLVRHGDEGAFYKKISRESAALLRMINDIILLSRLDEGTAKDAAENLDPVKICADIAKTLQDKASAKNITVSSEGDMSAFNGIYRYFYEMIFNLADNAVKYGNYGGFVKITLSETQSFRQIIVEDNGPGIPLEDQSRIFERFYRVDKSHSRRSEGTGLGLSIVKRAAKFFGGRVSVVSAVGQGACFKVVIPRSK